MLKLGQLIYLQDKIVETIFFLVLLCFWWGTLGYFLLDRIRNISIYLNQLSGKLWHLFFGQSSTIWNVSQETFQSILLPAHSKSWPC